MDKPQMIEHINVNLNYTIHDVKWIPCSAKFLAIGSKPNDHGALDVYEMNSGKADNVSTIDLEVPLKCCTFGASSLRNRHLAIGDFKGGMRVLDLERPQVAVYKVKGHETIINSIDGMGGKQYNCGPPEIVTGGRDGAVRVWDIRQARKPVVNITPGKKESQEDDTQSVTRDCWAVAFGNSFNNTDRIVAAGYDNGDLKLFDLRAMGVRWETTLKNGICSVEFDRREIEMNKMAVTTLEGGLMVYDMRTQHPTKGFTCVTERNAGRSVGSNGVITGPKATVWAVRHLPQNRELFATGGGTGSIRLWKYEYPEKRFADAGDTYNIGVAGTLTMLNATSVSSQPVHCLDWHPDKLGLGVCGSFDQVVRVLLTTKLNCY